MFNANIQLLLILRLIISVFYSIILAHFIKLISIYPCNRVKWLFALNMINIIPCNSSLYIQILLYLHGDQLKILWKRRANTQLKTSQK